MADLDAMERLRAKLAESESARLKMAVAMQEAIDREVVARLKVEGERDKTEQDWKRIAGRWQERADALEARLRAVIDAADRVMTDEATLLIKLNDAIANYRKVRDVQPSASQNFVHHPRNLSYAKDVLGVDVNQPASPEPSMYDYEGASDALGEAIKSVNPSPEESHKFAPVAGSRCTVCAQTWSQHGGRDDGK